MTASLALRLELAAIPHWDARNVLAAAIEGVRRLAVLVWAEPALARQRMCRLAARQAMEARFPVTTIKTP